MLKRCLLLASLLSFAGCTERVATTPIDFVVTWSPALECAKDPRRPHRMRIVATCGGREITSEFEIAEPASELLLPLGDCNIQAEVFNVYGRMVLSGSRAATLTKSDTPSVLIDLVETACEPGVCDRDGDGVADVDEEAMGLDPDNRDTDGDQIEDGLELTQCCSEPTVGVTPDCALFIQSVEPPFAEPGDAVIVRTTNEVDVATASLSIGGKPVPLSGSGLSRVLTGFIAQDAALGQAIVQSGQDSATHNSLFAVLFDAPKALSELASIPNLDNVVDMKARGNLLVMVATTNNKSHLVVHNRKSFATDSIQLPLTPGEVPVALDIRAQTISVLVRKSDGGGSAAFSIGRLMTTDVNLSPFAVNSIGGNSGEVRAVAIAPDQQSAYVLVTTRRPVKVSFGLTTPAGQTTTEALEPGGGEVPEAITASTPLSQVFADCVGITASLSVPGDPDASNKIRLLLSCRGQTNGALVHTGDADACLATGTGADSNDPSCWSILPTPGVESPVGRPLVDVNQQRVYLLSNKGVLTGDFTSLVLTALIPFDRVDDESRRPMVLDQDRGFLYVADGRVVRRLLPRGTSENERLGLPFPLAGGDESISHLALYGDGSVLDAARLSGDKLHEILGVCTSRETGMICN